MTREEVYEDCLQAEKEETERRERIVIEIEYSGIQELEYEDCTLEEAIESAKQEFRYEYVGICDNVQIDEISEV